ncbi:hypothetical protein CI238_10267, partial [Colletotrichum incanum]
LIQLYLPLIGHQITSPPPRGRLSICLNKKNTLADLMKHTLYVLSTKEDDWDLWMFYEKAAHADFAGEVVLGLSTKYANKFFLEPWEGTISDITPYAFVYATIPEGCDGYLVLLTQNAARLYLPIRKPDAPDAEVWHRLETYPFPEVFSMAKDKLRKFKMAQIHGKEGVFTERYDRESCMNRLDEYQE